MKRYLQFGKGFDYCIDMSQSPFNRVKLNGLNEEDSYRITMTDYCYRNYKMYLQRSYRSRHIFGNDGWID